MKFFAYAAFSLLLLPMGASLAQSGTSGARAPAPIKGFTYPIFDAKKTAVDGKLLPEGMIKGDEVRYVSETQFDVVNMNISAYADNDPKRVETVLIAPAATVSIKDHLVVSGEKSMRIIRENLDASGNKWKYDHTQKSVVIEGNVHVIFTAELKDILK